MCNFLTKNYNLLLILFFFTKMLSNILLPRFWSNKSMRHSVQLMPNQNTSEESHLKPIS